MKLSELKQTRMSQIDMSEIYDKIKCWVDAGSKEVYFNHRGNEKEDEITDLQVAKLREDGYTVEWNRPCLRYEVSGWE